MPRREGDKDGRVFFGKGLIRSESDLDLIKLPDPNQDSLYAEAEESAKHKGEFALGFRTRMGIVPTYLSIGIENFSYDLYDNPGLVEEVEAEVKQRISEVAPSGGYMVSSGNSFAAYCKPENVLAMAEAVQRYGKYPIMIA